MKPIEFELNTHGMRYEYHRTREGPNWFMCYYKDSAVIRTDPKDAWRTIGVAKFTDTGKALKACALECHDKYVTSKLEARPDTSFASEAIAETEESPTDNTKMIT